MLKPKYVIINLLQYEIEKGDCVARINSLRVNDVVDYETDIKGKRLIRLSAGVCSGKNYWIVQTAAENPNLRILLITSRKNTVLAQSKKLGANTFIDLDVLNSDSVANEYKRVVCTNASIEKFFKNRYKANDITTHLWDKFDLIVLDEAHSLTSDAIFTECFHVERFLKYAYYKNPNCDILFMSGTLTPLNWMIDAKNTPPIHNLNCFDKCVHLEPDYVYVIDKDRISSIVYTLWRSGEKVIYFANHKMTIAKITAILMEQGIPADNFGFSFNYVEDDLELPFPKAISNSLEEKIKTLNTALITEELVPEAIKIVFSTSKNKEGINILNDDIKTVIADTHDKADLIQIAGRVRGNPLTGTGIKRLIIVGDAKQHTNHYPNEFLYVWNKHILDALTATLNECVSKGMRDISTPEDLIKKLPQYGSSDKLNDAYKYIRYDYIGENFAAYEGRLEGERQYINDIKEFKEIVNDSVLRKDSAGEFMSLSGKEILEQEWFKWSEAYIFSTKSERGKIKTREDMVALAKEQIVQFLKDNNYLGEGTYITKADRDVAIREELERLGNIHGYKNLGIKEGFSRVGSALKKFGIQIEEHGKKKGYEKYKVVVLEH